MGKEYVRSINVESLVPTAVEPIFVEDFDWDYDITKSGSAPYTIERDPTRHVAGRASLSLLCRADLCANKAANFILYPPTTEAKYYEIITTFMINSDSATDGFMEWYFELVNSNAGGSHEYRMRITTATGIIQVETPAGQQNVGTLPQALLSQTWYTIRCVFDMVNFRWVSIDFQGYDIDVSAHAFQSYTAGQYRNSYYFHTYSTNNDNPWGIWIDKIIIRGVDFNPI